MNPTTRLSVECVSGEDVWQLETRCNTSFQGWRIGCPFIGPIRSCHRAGASITVLMNYRR